MPVVAHYLNLAIDLFIFVLFGRLILDYITVFNRDWRPRGIVLVIAEVIYSLTDPPLRAIRRYVRPIRLGTLSLDLSFLILIIGLQVIQHYLAKFSG